MLTKIWRGIKVCLGVSQFVIALAVVALLETALVLVFLKWNPYVRTFSLQNFVKPDSQSSGGALPSSTRLGLHSFTGVPFHRPPNHSDQECGYYTDEEQEDFYHLLVHLHLGSLGRIHIRAQREKDRWFVLGDFLELPGLPLRSHNFRSVPRRPLIPGTKRKRI